MGQGENIQLVTVVTMTTSEDVSGKQQKQPYTEANKDQLK